MTEYQSVYRALNRALERKHILSSWKEVDPEGRVKEEFWAICLKCGDSIFTYHDGSDRGLEDECQEKTVRLVLPLFRQKGWLVATGSWAQPYLNQNQEVGFTEGGTRSLNERHEHTFTESGRIHCEEPLIRFFVGNPYRQSSPSS